MPKVVRQSVAGINGPPARTGSVLDRIGQVRASNVNRLKVSLYGHPKTGKTRLACTFPKPLLIAGAEDGTASVVGVAGVEFVKLEGCEELRELVEGPVSDGRWATVVLDTATKLREMRIKELFAEMGLPVPDRKPFLFADAVWKGVWVQTGKDLRDFLGPLLDLPRMMDLNVVIIAQEQVLTEENSAASSDVIRPAVGSALGKSLCMFVNAECDYIGQTFIRRQTGQRKDKTGKLSEYLTGRKEYCLRVGPDDTYVTGFRQKMGAPALPDAIVDPSYAKIVALIEDKK